MSFSNISRKTNEFIQHTKVETLQFVQNPRTYVTQNQTIIMNTAIKVAVIVTHFAIMVTNPLYALSFAATFVATSFQIIKPEQVTKVTDFLKNFVSKGGWNVAVVMAISICVLSVTPLSLTLLGAGVATGISFGFIYLNRNANNEQFRELAEIVNNK